MDILDTLAPARLAIPKVSRELHNSGRYNACVTRTGIVVQSHATGTGRLLPVSHAQYGDYLDSFASCIDWQECDAGRGVRVRAKYFLMNDHF